MLVSERQLPTKTIGPHPALVVALALTLFSLSGCSFSEDKAKKACTQWSNGSPTETKAAFAELARGEPGFVIYLDKLSEILKFESVYYQYLMQSGDFRKTDMYLEEKNTESGYLKSTLSMRIKIQQIARIPSDYRVPSSSEILEYKRLLAQINLLCFE